MGDMGELFKAQREQRQAAGADNRGRAINDFPKARGRVKATNTMRLFFHSETHYTLRGKTGDRRWLINIYPGNRRISRGRGAPRLELPAEWTLLDVATAAEGLAGG